MCEACEHARIIPPISFHILHHTWASLALMARVPLLVVAKNLGHKHTRMVEHHYGHLARSFTTEAIRAGAPVYRYRGQQAGRAAAVSQGHTSGRRRGGTGRSAGCCRPFG